MLQDKLPEWNDLPEDEIRAAAAAYAYGKLDSHFTHIPRIKSTIFGRMLSDLGAYAYYAPVTAEVIVGNGLSSAHKISASMHELMHFVGVTDEDAAVYHSVIALLDSKNLSLCYSGLIEAYVHVGASLHEMDPDKYSEIYAKLPPRVTKDLELRRDNVRKSELGDRLNDAAITLRDPRGGASYKNAAPLLVGYFGEPQGSQ